MEEWERWRSVLRWRYRPGSAYRFRLVHPSAIPMPSSYEIWSADPQFVVYRLDRLPLAGRSDGIFAIIAAPKGGEPEKVLHVGHSNLGGDIFGTIEQSIKTASLIEQGANRVAVKRLKFSGSQAIFGILLEDECITLREKFLAPSSVRRSLPRAEPPR